MRVALRYGGVDTSQANCVGEGDVMFGEDVAAAKAVCEGCPQRRTCLMYALDNEIADGVWGGTDWDERTRLCPVCRHAKQPSALGCTQAHSLERLTRLIELEADGDTTVSFSGRGPVSAPTRANCIIPRGRSHSTAKAYRRGCRCRAALDALILERARRAAPKEQPPRTAEERFMAMVEVDGAHWRWTGSRNGSGYGNFWDGKRTIRAHIWAYEHFVGTIPDNCVLRPLEGCGSGSCVNPSCHRAERR